MTSSTKPPRLGPFKPTLIIHGGAGRISRASIPPELWVRYRASLLRYLTTTKKLLDSGTSALDAACHAVTLLEDDVLFNCGRGSVFTERGSIEMEASVMICSVDSQGPPTGGIKRGAAVSLVRNTRHPILLAKEVLLQADDDTGLGGTSSMHCHLSGRDAEEWGWTQRDLEKKPDQWFWTQRRWEEHRRGLKHFDGSYTYADLIASVDPLGESVQLEDALDDVKEFPSQGTVGAVCLDSWGNLAVATSTGGLTNKKVGRIGDTPTMGAGFWAEDFTEDVGGSRMSSNPSPQFSQLIKVMPALQHIWTNGNLLLGSCLGSPTSEDQHMQIQRTSSRHAYTSSPPKAYQPYQSPATPTLTVPSQQRRQSRPRRRAIALSGTGNGDSFIRTNACRAAASICQLGRPLSSLAEAVHAVAGQGGLLQQSAGDRWGKTGEGEGGIIGLEVIDSSDEDRRTVSFNDEKRYALVSKKAKMTGRPVIDFNCGGLFRAYYEVDGETGEEKAKVMVFKDEY